MDQQQQLQLTGGTDRVRADHLTGSARPDRDPRDPRDAGDVDEAVYDVVESIPAGRVSTYGAVGRLVGVGPRRVARALSQGGAAVPWHRVVRADGTAAEPVRARQLALLAAEGVPVRRQRVDLAAVLWPDD